jgi:hypothetical protein
MRYTTAALTLSLAVLLAACGGAFGIEDPDEDKEPEPSGRTATVTVSAATDTAVNGTYSSNDVGLSEVERTDESNAESEVCVSHFDNLRRTGSTAEMTGTITYAPTTATRTAAELRSTVIRIAGVEYRLEGATGAGPDLSNHQVLYASAVLRTTSGTARSITLTGPIPLRAPRPSGC